MANFTRVARIQFESGDEWSLHIGDELIEGLKREVPEYLLVKSNGDIKTGTKLRVIKEILDELEGTEMPAPSVTEFGRVTPIVSTEPKNPSSLIKYAEYLPNARVLTLTLMNGDQYNYYSVPAIVYHQLINAPSAGAYYNQYIKGNYRESNPNG